MQSCCLTPSVHSSWQRTNYSCCYTPNWKPRHPTTLEEKMSDNALAQVFTAEDHTSEDNTERTVRTIVYLPDFHWSLNGTLLYSFDDETFYTLLCEGIGGSETIHTLTFLDPHHKVEGQIVRTDNVVTYNEHRYVLQPGPFTPANIVQIPQTRLIEFFGVTESGIMVHLSRYEFEQPDQEPDEGHRLYAGRGGTLRHYAIDGIDPQINGMHVDTVERCWLALPTAYGMKKNPDRFPMWNGEKLNALNPEDYIITEVEGRHMTAVKR